MQLLAARPHARVNAATVCRAGGADAAGMHPGAVARDVAGRDAARGLGQDDGAAGQGDTSSDEGALGLATARLRIDTGRLTFDLTCRQIRQATLT